MPYPTCKLQIALKTFPKLNVYFHFQNIRWTKVILLGEMAEGQAPFQQFCFVTNLGDTDLLSAESVLRLRQVSLGKFIGNVGEFRWNEYK